MKRYLFLLVVSLFCFSYADATTIRFASLEQVIRESDTIFIAKITSGKCTLANCKESQTRYIPKEYQFACTRKIYGKCPSINKITNSSDYCVGCSYIFLHQRQNPKDTYFSIELRNDETRLVYKGWYWGLPSELHQSEEGLNSVREYHYYEYKDFVAAVKKLKML